MRCVQNLNKNVIKTSAIHNKRERDITTVMFGSSYSFGTCNIESE